MIIVWWVWAVATLVLVSGFYFSDAFGQSSIVVTTDKVSYTEGEIILITGEVSQLLGGYSLSVTVIHPDGSIVSIQQITVGADKKFSTTTTAGGALMDIPGTYTVTVQYGDNANNAASTSFEFEHIITITVSTDTTIIGNGDTVVISGNIEPYDSSSGKGTTYAVFSPDDNAVSIGQLTPSSDGSFQQSLVAGGPLWKLTGDYVIQVSYGTDTGETIINYVGGEVVDNEPEPESSEPQIQVGEPYKDQYGFWLLPVSGTGFYPNLDISLNFDQRLTDNVLVDSFTINDKTDVNGSFDVVLKSQHILTESGTFSTTVRDVITHTFSDIELQLGNYPENLITMEMTPTSITKGKPTIFDVTGFVNIPSDVNQNNLSDNLEIQIGIEGQQYTEWGFGVNLMDGTNMFHTAQQITLNNVGENNVYVIYNGAVRTFTLNVIEPAPTPIPDDSSSQVTIQTADNDLATPGCLETSVGCYTPNIAAVIVGGVVTMTNTDSTGIHTFTSGTVDGFAPSPDGIFDSGMLMKPGDSFDYNADTVGEFPYYCSLHVWMQGVLIVVEDPMEEEVMEEEPTPDPYPTPEPNSITVRTSSSSYDDWNDIVILGELSPAKSNASITLQIFTEGNLFYNQPVTTSSDGSYSYAITEEIMGGVKEGNYLVRASYENLVAEYEFEIEFDDYVPPTPEPEVRISVKTDRNSYHIGDELKITGVVRPSDGSSVMLQIFSSSGNLVYDERVRPSSSGTFREEIKLAGSDYRDIGTYTVKAISKSASDKVQFILKVGIPDSLPEPEPTPDSVRVSIPVGTSVPGCEETNSCFSPFEVQVNDFGTVTWINVDTAAHTVTGGNASEGPSGGFDSSLLMSGASFSQKFDRSGVYDYFCMVHPWMTGFVLVGDVTAPPRPDPKPGTRIDLEVSTDRRIYDLGDIVKVEVEIDGFSGTQRVAIDVTDSRGSTVVSRSLTFTSDGSKEIEFRISEDFRTGTYKVTATTSDNGKTIKDTAHFKIKSQFNSFKITNVQVTNQQGNPSNLEAGELGFIKVNLESSKSIATLVTVNIFDADLTSIGIGSVQTTLSSGTSEIILSFMIPADAATGPATVYVNAFSDWPSNGGIPLTGEFSITEFIGNSSPPTPEPTPEPTPNPEPEVTIEPVAGSGVSGCEDTAEGCYSPSTATVFVGGVVLFSNTDVYAHTFTSFVDLSDAGTVGNEFGEPGLLKTGESFEWIPDTVGEVKYFCMIHPWMTGTILVVSGGGVN